MPEKTIKKAGSIAGVNVRGEDYRTYPNKVRLPAVETSANFDEKSRKIQVRLLVFPPIKNS
jgi:hypothetical protein